MQESLKATQIDQTRVEQPVYFYQSIWWVIFFAPPDATVFQQEAVKASVSHRGMYK